MTDFHPTPLRRLRAVWRAEPMRWPLVVVLCAMTAAYALTPGVFPRKLAGDGWWYYAQTRSLVMDGDLDLAANAPHLPWRKKKNAVTGHIENPYALGTSILWLPFFAAAHGIAVIRHQFDPLIPIDGYGDTTPEATVFGTTFWVFWGLLLCYRALRRRLDAALALCTVLVSYLTSNLLLYSLLHPGYSHGCSMFAVSALLWYWDRTRGGSGLRRWTILGALVGLATLVRPQNVLFAAIPIGEAVLLGVSSIRRGDRRAIGRLVLSSLGAAAIATLVFAAQMLAWRYYYGSYITVPQGPGYMVWDQFGVQSVLGALFWSKNGLLPWHPIGFAACAGLLIGLRHPAHRALSAALLVGLLAQLWLNASNIDIEGGWSFGQRKFLNCFFVFACGLGWFFDAARRWLRLHRRALPHLAIALPVALLVTLNIALTVRVSNKQQLVSRNVDMRRVYLGAATTVLDGIWNILGNPAAFPAPWIYAALYDVPPAKFDRVVGRFLLYQRPSEPRFNKNRFRCEFDKPSCRDLIGSRGTLVPEENAVRSQGNEIRIIAPMWFQHDDLIIVAAIESTADVALLWNGAELASIYTADADHPRIAVRVPAGTIDWGVNGLRLTGAAPFVLHNIDFFLAKADARS